MNCSVVSILETVTLTQPLGCFYIKYYIKILKENTSLSAKIYKCSKVLSDSVLSRGWGIWCAHVQCLCVGLCAASDCKPYTERVLAAVKEGQFAVLLMMQMFIHSDNNLKLLGSVS